MIDKLATGSFTVEIFPGKRRFPAFSWEYLDSERTVSWFGDLCDCRHPLGCG